MATVTPIDLRVANGSPPPPDSAPRVRDPGEVLADLGGRLSDMPVGDRVRSAMAPEIIAAAASLRPDHPEVLAFAACLRAAVRAGTGVWAKSVNEARAARAAEEKAAEERRRAAEIDPRSFEGKLARIAKLLKYNKHDDPIANHHNLSTILAEDPRWEGVLAYHAMRETVCALKAPPWSKTVSPDGGAAAGEWADEDTTRLSAWLSKEWGLDAKTSMIGEAVNMMAHGRTIDPVREYFDGLPAWDGIPRLDTWMARHLGASDSPYVRAVSRRWMISGVARALRPGCKVDCVLVLVGIQGRGKSSVLRALCPEPGVFADLDLDGSSKDDSEAIRGKWIVELGEMSAMSRADIRKLKRFVSLETDRFRPSYGRRAKDFPRRTILAATSNDEECLKDTTGDRRWWPVDVDDEIDRQAAVRGIEADRDQMWAEALHLMNEGESWWVDTPDVEKLTREAQEDHRKAHPWEDKIRPMLAAEMQSVCAGGDACKCPRCIGVTPGEVLSKALSIDSAAQDQGKADIVRGVLLVCGWSTRRKGHGAQRRENGGRVRPFFPPPATEKVASAGESPAPAPTGTCPICSRVLGLREAGGCEPCPRCARCTSVPVGAPGSCGCG